MQGGFCLASSSAPCVAEGMSKGSVPHEEKQNQRHHGTARLNKTEALMSLILMDKNKLHGGSYYSGDGAAKSFAESTNYWC